MQDWLLYYYGFRDKVLFAVRDQLTRCNKIVSICSFSLGNLCETKCRICQKQKSRRVTQPLSEAQYGSGPGTSGLRRSMSFPTSSITCGKHVAAHFPGKALGTVLLQCSISVLEEPAGICTCGPCQFSSGRIKCFSKQHFPGIFLVRKIYQT